MKVTTTVDVEGGEANVIKLFVGKICLYFQKFYMNMLPSEYVEVLIDWVTSIDPL